MYVFLWFILLLIGVRGVIRLFFTFAPVGALMAGYGFVSLYHKVPKDKIYKGAVVVAMLICFFVLYSSSLRVAASIGPSFPPQWQMAMQWVKQNTAEDAVFAHWWDYGYWVQAVGERATVLDGGQPVAAWNYLFGRYVLTGQNETEALRFLYAHNVSYLLIDPSDMGKYTAFSSIGSDQNYDRMSYVSTFGLSFSDGKVFRYDGQFAFDDDLKLLASQEVAKPKGGYYQMVLTLDNTTVGTVQLNGVSNDGRPLVDKIQCLYMNGVEYTFDSGYSGCSVIVPFIDTNMLYPNSAAIFMSEKGRNAFWTKLYLRNYTSPYFTLVYKDDAPIGVYKDRGAWGPLMIWKITYPEGMELDPAMLSPDFPEGTFWS
jgi:asparagine N-glycosylation enzyme membrane subunit Stt3